MSDSLQPERAPGDPAPRASDQVAVHLPDHAPDDAPPDAVGVAPAHTDPHDGQPGDPRAAEGHGEAESEGILALLRERMIELESMPRSLRLITALTFGQMLAVAVFMVLQWIPQPALAVSWQDRQTTQMPVVIFVSCVLFLVVAWTFVLSGAMHGHWLLRLPVLGVFSFVLVTEPVAPPVGLIRIAMLALLWGWAAGIVVARFRRRRRAGAEGQARGRAQPLPLATMLFVALWLVGYDLLLLWAANWGQGAGNMLFPAYVTVQLEALSLFLVPVLFLAGSDLAELGEAVSARAAHALTRLSSPAPLVALTVVVPLAVVGWIVTHDARTPQAWLGAVAQALVIGAVVALALALVARWGHVASWPRQALPLAALALATLLVIAGEMVVVAYTVANAGPQPVLSPSDYTVYASPSATPFSIAYPTDWRPLPQRTDATGASAVIFDGAGAAHPGLFLVETFPLARVPLQQARDNAFARLCSQTCAVTELPAHGGWQVTGFHAGATVGRVWARADGARGALLVAEASSDFFDLLAPDFTRMVDSYRPDLSAAIPPARSDTPQPGDAGITLSVAVPAVAALLIGLPLVRRGRRRPGPAAMVGLFAVVFGLILLSYLPERLASLAGLPAAHVGLSLPSLQIAVAAATLGVLGWLALRRARRPLGGAGPTRVRELLALLLALNLALQIVVAFVAVYDQTLQVTFTVFQAVILIVGMTWDLLMSGEQITNRDDPSFPRHARLLLYFGYSMMVATAVLYFSSQTFAHPGAQSVAPFFEDDQWPQEGLLFLGAPLVITLFVINLSRWRRRGESRLGEASVPSISSVAASAAAPRDLLD